MYLCTHDSPNINQEIMTLLQERLFAMQDKQHAAFQAKLTPGVEKTALLPGRTTKPFRRPSRITTSAEAINPS